MNNISIFVKFRNIVFSFKIFGTKTFSMAISDCRLGYFGRGLGGLKCGKKSYGQMKILNVVCPPQNPP